MPNDPTVQVAFIGIIATFITTSGVVFVAYLNNRKERTDTAEEGVESTLRERIALRDEQIQDLRDDIKGFRIRLDQALEEIEEKTELIRLLRHELARAKGEA